MHTGAPWRWLPHDLPPWDIVCQQTRRWVVERDVAWASRFRGLARDDERLPHVLAGWHFVAFACLVSIGWSLYFLVHNTL